MENKKLAIIAHSTRGKEVIEILEMLGGKNIYNLTGNDNCAYYVIEYNEIRIGTYMFGNEPYCFFTLENFLKKYPYKIGDKVKTVYGKISNIIGCIWSADSCVKYKLETDDFNDNYYLSQELMPYEEKTMEEKSTNHVFDTEIISFDIAQRDKYELDLQGKFNVVLQEGKYYVKRIKPQHPKTYKECCDVLEINAKANDAQGYKADDIISFQELLIARDAYWEIAGVEMGLSEPWKPDWYDDEWPDMYYISYDGKSIEKGKGFPCVNIILIFPTEEMRDIFFDNFYNLIEKCKEFL